MALIEEIAKLPVNQRIDLVEEIWDSIAIDTNNSPLSPAQRDELKWRVANPSETTYSWEEVQSRARAYNK